MESPLMIIETCIVIKIDVVQYAEYILQNLKNQWQ